ncbi:MAG: 9-O-acetylesterase, partial [Pirellulaceae bacterium]|nr:9-O-acetylesterase [Pirellulaceae bacterium]
MTTPLRPLLVAILAVIVFSSPSPADVKLPSLFSDHMLLQQSTAAPIWGWAEPGEDIRVTATWGKEARTRADQEGRWKVFLPTPSHGGPYQVRIAGHNQRTL